MIQGVQENTGYCGYQYIHVGAVLRLPFLASVLFTEAEIFVGF